MRINSQACRQLQLPRPSLDLPSEETVDGSLLQVVKSQVSIESLVRDWLSNPSARLTAGGGRQIVEHAALVGASVLRVVVLAECSFAL